MGVKVVTVMRWYVQDEVNQDYSEQNEVDGMKKGADCAECVVVINLQRVLADWRLTNSAWSDRDSCHHRTVQWGLLRLCRTDRRSSATNCHSDIDNDPPATTAQAAVTSKRQKTLSFCVDVYTAKYAHLSHKLTIQLRQPSLRFSCYGVTGYMYRPIHVFCQHSSVCCHSMALVMVLNA